MAKKKVADHRHHHHQSKDSHKEEEPTHRHKEETFPVTAEPELMEQDPGEKIRSLKSLNSLLLKETFDRRQQVESLEQARVALEAELARLREEKQAMEAELTRADQRNVEMELQKAVVCVFLEAQIGHMAAELRKLEEEGKSEFLGLKREVGELTSNLEKERAILGEMIRERDLAKGECQSWSEKVNRMRNNLEEMERARELLEEGYKKLEVKHDQLLREKHEDDKTLEGVRREKDSMENDLARAYEEIYQLKRKMEALVMEKKDMEVQKSKQDVKINGLENGVGELKGLVARLQKEEQRLQGEVMEFEKRCYEMEEREKEMVKELEALGRDRKEKEVSIEELQEERGSLEKQLKKAEEKLEDKEQLMDEIIRKKIEIEEENIGKRSEIARLNEEAAELRNTISSLELSYGDEREKNEALLSEVVSQKEALDQIFIERESTQKDLDEERKVVKGLKSKVVELEMIMEKTLGDLARITGEHEKLMMQKNALEHRFEILRREKESVEKTLSDSQQTIEELQAKIESTGMRSERALTLLKNAASFLSKGELVDEPKADEDIQPYVRELELIKCAFQVKESVVEDLNKQLEFLQDSVAKAQKKNGFWTMLSSATTVLAAASFAYLSRVR